MKKFLALLFSAALISAVAFSGCSLVKSNSQTAQGNASTKTVVKTNENSENNPKAMKEALQMSDQDFSDIFGDIDTVLGDDFEFTDASKLTSKQLFSFYAYITQTEAFSQNYLNKFSSGKENTYVIPVSEIQNVINTYFDGAKFDVSNLPDYIKYNKSDDTITASIMGCGGVRFPRVSLKEILSSDTLRTTVDFYADSSHEKVDFTKVYTIKYSDTGYKFVSIVEK